MSYCSPCLENILLGNSLQGGFEFVFAFNIGYPRVIAMITLHQQRLVKQSSLCAP